MGVSAVSKFFILVLIKPKFSRIGRMNVLSLAITALSQHSLAFQKINKTASLLRFYFARQQYLTAGLFV
jgi:hypothetical protein